MEARSDLKQRPYPPIHADGARGWRRYLGENLQQRALACTVSPDDTHHITLLHLEADVFQCPNVVAFTFGISVVGFSDGEKRVFFPKHFHRPPAVQVVSYGARRHLSQAILFTNIIEFYCC